MKSSSPVDSYLNSLSTSSRVAMTDSLSVIADFFDSKLDELTWQKLRYEDAQRLRAFLAGKYKGRTVNRILAAYRGVLKACWRLGLMSTDDYHHAKDVRAVRVRELPAGRRLSTAEIRKLVRTETSEGWARRDSALVATMYAAGLRRFEASMLRISDYDRETGALVVRGKGNKVRQVKIQKEWREPLEVWLDTYQPKKSWPLFPSRRRLEDVPKRMSLTGIAVALEARRLLAKVAPFSTHDLRRTLISNLLEAGVDLVVVQRIAGHENVNTTASYDRRDKLAEEAAIDKLEGL